MPHSIRLLPRYRSTYIPEGLADDQVEEAAARGALPFVQFRATSASEHGRLAGKVTGRPIHETERREEALEAA